jgi:hypothetical protein
MKKREVNRIDVALIGLQVIALMKDLVDVEMVSGRVKKVIIGKQRRLSRSHIGENHASCFLAGISRMANCVPMLAAARLSRLLQAAPFNVIEPAMIKTPEAAVFDPSIAQVRSPVRAVNPQKPGSPVIIAEQYQLFTQNLYPERHPSRRQLF